MFCKFWGIAIARAGLASTSLFYLAGYEFSDLFRAIYHLWAVWPDLADLDAV